MKITELNESVKWWKGPESLKNEGGEFWPKEEFQETSLLEQKAKKRKKYEKVYLIKVKEESDKGVWRLNPEIYS